MIIEKWKNITMFNNNPVNLVCTCTCNRNVPNRLSTKA